MTALHCLLHSNIFAHAAVEYSATLYFTAPYVCYTPNFDQPFVIFLHHHLRAALKVVVNERVDLSPRQNAVIFHLNRFYTATDNIYVVYIVTLYHIKSISCKSTRVLQALQREQGKHLFQNCHTWRMPFIRFERKLKEKGGTVVAVYRSID